MSGKRNWTSRMDGKTPPPLHDTPLPKGRRRGWRDEYDCFVLKGKHTFELVERVDWWLRKKNQTIVEYYTEKWGQYLIDKTIPGRWAYFSYTVKCTACGKQEWCSIKNIKKKVRQQTTLPKWFSDLIGESYSGSTGDFGSPNLGSTPSSPA